MSASSLLDRTRSPTTSLHHNPLVPTNMLGASIPNRLAGNPAPRVPAELGGTVGAAPQVRSLASLKSSSSRNLTLDMGPHSRMSNTKLLASSSSLGGNTLRISASDMALLQNAPPLRNIIMSGKPPPKRTRNPLTGDIPNYEPSHASSHSDVLLPNGRPLGTQFPARGSLSSIGNGGSTYGGASMSPSGFKKSEAIRYELFLEQQRREQAEKELMFVRIHGRSRPPWVGDGLAAGYADLFGRRITQDSAENSANSKWANV